MTTEQEAYEVDTAVRELSRLVVADEDLDDTLARVAGLACRAVKGCDLASVTMINGGRPSTPVQTDPLAKELDTVQYRSDHGPCLEAYSVGDVVEESVPASSERWPEFTEAAQNAGVRSVLAVPLSVNDRQVGALNLYSQASEAFDEADRENAVLFSEQAAVACANSDGYWRARSLNDHLREALESRDIIGQAKGILMARRGCTPDAAFEALRKVSQHRNVKLREIAEQVVYLGDLDESRS